MTARLPATERARDEAKARRSLRPASPLVLLLLVGLLSCRRDEQPAPASDPEEPPHAPASAHLDDLDEPDPGEDGVGARRWLLPPGMCAEVDFEMKKGAELVADFTSNSTLQIDAHTHVGEKVIIYGRSEGSEGGIDFTAPADGVFSLRWFHPGEADAASILLDVKLRGDARVVAWIP